MRFCISACRDGREWRQTGECANLTAEGVVKVEVGMACGTQEDVCWSGHIQVATTGWHVGKEFDGGVMLAVMNLAGHVSQWAECLDVPTGEPVAASWQPSE